MHGWGAGCLCQRKSGTASPRLVTWNQTLTVGIWVALFLPRGDFVSKNTKDQRRCPGDHSIETNRPPSPMNSSWVGQESLCPHIQRLKRRNLPDMCGSIPSLPLASDGLNHSWICLRPSDGLVFVIQPCLWSDKIWNSNSGMLLLNVCIKCCPLTAFSLCVVLTGFVFQLLSLAFCFTCDKGCFSSFLHIPLYVFGLLPTAVSTSLP